MNGWETIIKAKWLAVDTSTSSMTVAVMEGATLLGEKNSRAERNHSMYLVPNMQQLLQSLHLRPGDLQAVAVGFGPGSYTGVRIGVTVAKTMAWSLRVPLLSVSSLEGMALGGFGRLEPPLDGTVWVVPLMDARRGQVYTGLYAATEWPGEHRAANLSGDAAGTGGFSAPAGACPSSAVSPLADKRWSCLVPDGIRPMEQWIESLRERLQRASAGDKSETPRCIAFVGEVERFVDQTERLAALWTGTVTALPHDIRAYDIARLAYPRWVRGESTDPFRLVPNYTQPPEAEVKLLGKPVT
jgi:tRNA threonylcarbamoyladenosine biosynthesis protein TsaB